MNQYTPNRPSDILYGMGSLFLSIHLFCYPTLVIIGTGHYAADMVRYVFWGFAIIFPFPFLGGLILDSRLSILARIGLGMIGAVLVGLIIFILPFGVRTYMFDALTSFVSLLAIGLLALSVFLVRPKALQPNKPEMPTE